MKDAGELPVSLATPIEIVDPKNPEHGHFACNFALMASKPAGLPPRTIADRLLDLLIENDELQSIEVAGPGFLNVRLKPAFIAHFVREILFLGPLNLPRSTSDDPKRINVEFVSVNPNGPITIGSGRGASFGDTLARVLEAVGNEVSREYYINDGVNSTQMQLFAASVRALAFGEPVPEDGYKGDYVQDVADAIKPIIPAGQKPEIAWFQKVAQEAMIERPRGDLKLFQIQYDTWFSEQSLHDSGRVEKALQILKDRGMADMEPHRTLIKIEGKERTETVEPQEPGTLWLRSTRFGDDKDRVLIRANGRPAYIAADVAYLESKLGERMFDKALLILGPDHHGYIPRLYSVSEALGYAPKEKFEIVIHQQVNFVKDGQKAPMRKRDGNIYELRDLINELGDNVAPHLSVDERKQAGSDVTRFFYLMRSPDTSMDFDIDLATKQSDENPVFYVQYAHARICSVLRKAEEAGFKSNAEFDSDLLHHAKELDLVMKILDLPEEVKRCAKDYSVNRLTTFAIELARTYHHFYDVCRVIQPEQPELTQARVALSAAAKIGLQAALAMLGVSAPERMERAEPAHTP